MQRKWIVRMGAAALVAMTGLNALADGMPRQIRADFSENRTGWHGPAGSGGKTFIDPAVGFSGPSLHTRFEDFGITFDNSQVRWLEALKHPGRVEIGLKTNTFSIFFFSQEVSRPLVLEIRDHKNPPEGFPYVSVWIPLGTLAQADAGWRKMAVRIDDTQAAELPAGWGGYGAEDPNTAEPMLPPGRTFADVLANADQIAFTTLEPGFFYGASLFDVAIDDVFVKHVRSAD